MLRSRGEQGRGLLPVDLLCTRQCALYDSQEGGSYFTLQMNQKTLREKEGVPSHTAGVWQSWDSNLAVSNSKTLVFFFPCFFSFFKIKKWVLLGAPAPSIHMLFSSQRPLGVLRLRQLLGQLLL